MKKWIWAVALSLPLTVSAQQATTAEQAPKTDTSYIDEKGTAHITRVVPLPETLSDEARHWMSRQVSDAPHPSTVEEDRRGVDAWQESAGVAFRKVYPTTVTREIIAGVPVRVIMPPAIPPENKDRLLINLHGGGFRVDSGSMTETEPIASLTKMKVVAVLYRLAPEHPYPAAVDDAIAVYKDALKTYKPEHIAIYGTSAGAILTGEVAVRIKLLGLPEPGALGIFSGMGDLSRNGDSWSLYALEGFSGHLDPPKLDSAWEYVDKTDRKDPVLSPVYADLHGMPPTLFITSGRDLLLSGTVDLHRAFYKAGNDAQLIVFDTLPHAFWNTLQLPESREAFQDMADFFVKKVGSGAKR